MDRGPVELDDTAEKCLALVRMRPVREQTGCVEQGVCKRHLAAGITGRFAQEHFLKLSRSVVGCLRFARVAKVTQRITSPSMGVCQLHSQGVAVRLFFQQAREQLGLVTPRLGRLVRLIEVVVNLGDLPEKLCRLLPHPQVAALVGKEFLVESQRLLQDRLPGAVELRLPQKVAP